MSRRAANSLALDLRSSGARETRTGLRLATRLGYLDEPEAKPMDVAHDGVAAMILGLLRRSASGLPERASGLASGVV